MLNANQTYIEISAINKKLNSLIWHTDETTKALNKLIRKQEKLKNFIKELKND